MFCTLEEVKVNSEKWLSLDDLLNEKWKYIENTNNLYQISNYGRIKAKAKKVNAGLINNKQVLRKERIIKLQKNNLGYLHTSISVNHMFKNINIHREVAKAFIPNPNNLPVVNHKDENPSNPRFDNLEWCTHKYNINYKNRNNKASKTMLEKEDYFNRINQYDLDGNFIKQWRSIKNIEKNIKISRKSVSRCCRGLQKTAGGYKWGYANIQED